MNEPEARPPMDKPGQLTGLRILVTRPELALGIAPACPTDPLVEHLLSLGAEVFFQPAIRLSPPTDWHPVDAALASLHDYDWLVFSSANGVRVLLERMSHATPICQASLPMLAAMGPGTAEELARYGLRADLVPDEYRAEALAESLAAQAQGKRFLLARASRGREVLAEQLTAAGATVDQIVVYISTDVEKADEAILDRLNEGSIDWITVTSSAIARSLARLFGDSLRLAKLASISPITSGVLQELGYAPLTEARQYTLPGLVAAIVDYRP